jgi:hypothetical protein
MSFRAAPYLMVRKPRHTDNVGSRRPTFFKNHVVHRVGFQRFLFIVTILKAGVAGLCLG